MGSLSTVAGGGTNYLGSVLMRAAVVFLGAVNALALFGVVLMALTFVGVVTTTAVAFLAAANAVLFGVV